MAHAAERARVVAEGDKWCGTKWHHYAAVLGHGVDCARLIIKAYAGAGLIEDFVPPEYPPDWHCHRSEERFVETVQRFAVEYDWKARGLFSADIVLWKYGRCFSHGGIVTDWPSVIHAFAPNGVVEKTDISLLSELTVQKDGSPRPMRAFTFWPEDLGLADL
jgi:cell wall-associated NlpC family hydrolase